jgi:hypothetical protein
MYSPAYSEMKSLLQKELDIESADFITTLELLGYFNEGVDMVESAIHTIYEDYFLTTAPLSFVSGQSQYSLPTDIYAQKVRQIWYNDNNARNYEIRKVKQLKEIQFATQPDLYKWMLTNSLVTGLKINLYPTPQETNSNGIIWYIRNALRFSGADTDVCDIPEFTAVVVQYARWKCMNKEGHPDTMMALQDLANMKQMMVDTLSARVPDEHNEIIQDFSFYYDFDSYDGGY